MQGIREGFRQANAELLTSSFDVDYSGSTVVIALVLGRRLICANVGDSRAVLGSLKGPDAQKAWVAAPLSRDHKPDLPDERRRILQSEGRVEQFQGATSTRLTSRRPRREAGGAYASVAQT